MIWPIILHNLEFVYCVSVRIRYQDQNSVYSRYTDQNP